MVKIQHGPRPVDQDIVHVSLREPTRSHLVYAPSYPLLASELHKRLAQRHLVASEDGSHIAAVTRRMGSSCSIVVHSSPELPLPSSVFGEAMILHVYSDCAVKAWGEYDGRRGIWMLTKHCAPRLMTLFDRVDAVVPSPFGTVVIGTLGDGQRRYVIRDTEVVVPEGTRLVMDDRGVSHGMLPLGSGARRSWILPPPTDPRLSADEGGPPIYPLPFVADRVEPFLYHGRMMCVLRDGNSDAYWHEVDIRKNGRVRREGVLTDMGRDGTDTGIDFVWPSPDTSSIVNLLRVQRKDGSISRRLLLNSTERVYEGNFCMRESDLRWSPDGSQFVAHLRLVDSDGNQRNEMIVTKGGRRDVIHGMAYEPSIDNSGRVAYVLEDGSGRHVVAGSSMTSGYPYAWNIAHGEDLVTANVLVSGKIHRIELPYGR
ncbi:MAG: hypothetical protein WCO25_00860 [Candidatus Uhrbacteria bacterium]